MEDAQLAVEFDPDLDELIGKSRVYKSSIEISCIGYPDIVRADS